MLDLDLQSTMEPEPGKPLYVVLDSLKVGVAWEVACVPRRGESVENPILDWLSSLSPKWHAGLKGDRQLTPTKLDPRGEAAVEIAAPTKVREKCSDGVIRAALRSKERKIGMAEPAAASRKTHQDEKAGRDWPGKAKHDSEDAETRD
jgi:hypothetical protein